MGLNVEIAQILLEGLANARFYAENGGRPQTIAKRRLADGDGCSIPVPTWLHNEAEQVDQRVN
jgi:hypothetical protein